MADFHVHSNREGSMNIKKLLSVFMDRAAILVILFTVQLAILLWAFYMIDEYFRLVFGGFTVLSIFVIVYILNSPINPNFKLAWVVPILVIPVFGTLFYIFVKTEFGARIMKERLRRIFAQTKDQLKQDEETIRQLEREAPDAARLAKYMMKTSAYPIYKNSKAHYYPTGEEAFEAMLEELKKAKHFIFMEYFIIEKGVMLGEIQRVLEEKVREGVEVRFMYDGMVALSQMPDSYMQELNRVGIRVKQFLPIRPILSTSYNNRDHRKIMVIDGKAAFTGGINLADEYINKKERFGHWKDNAILIRGDAVRSFTMMFLQMWNVDETIREDYERYLYMPHGNDDLQGYVLPYGDSPLDNERVGENVYLDIINGAKEYVYIMTPYLILDDALIGAMQFAAKSGVDVIIMMPHIPDKWYAYTLARTYYEELIQAGVKIYEYTPGFVHSKVFVSDDKKATVGTVNLDYRSLYLHFECGVYLQGGNVIKEVKRDFTETLKRCHRITPEEARNLTLMQRFFGRFVLRLFAPLL